ncbi:MAG: hypothetical protein O2960_25905, partial [Verrucomicrobia bacterium]|nr:hypothetical protein [Verrucomicrobiota bacterium]
TNRREFNRSVLSSKDPLYFEVWSLENPLSIQPHFSSGTAAFQAAALKNMENRRPDRSRRFNKHAAAWKAACRFCMCRRGANPIIP